MNRRHFAAALALPVLAGPRAFAQTARLPRVVVVSYGFESAPISRDGKAAFEAGLRALGWMPGSTIAVEYRWADNSSERLAAIVAEIVRTPPDAIVARTTPVQEAVTRATRSIPIVLGGAPDPVGQGFVGNLARPGGNVTGLSLRLNDLVPKRLEMLKEAVPSIRRVALLGGRDNDTALAADGARAAGALGIEVRPMVVKTAQGLPDAFAAIARQKCDALAVHADGGGPLDREVATVVGLAAKHRLPAIYAWRQYVEAGGLMALVVDIDDVQRQSARFVDRILKGAKPGDLPVEEPTRMQLMINTGTARSLSIAMPPALLQRADLLVK